MSKILYSQHQLAAQSMVKGLTCNRSHTMWVEMAQKLSSDELDDRGIPHMSLHRHDNMSLWHMCFQLFLRSMKAFWLMFDIYLCIGTQEVRFLMTRFSYFVF